MALARLLPVAFLLFAETSIACTQPLALPIKNVTLTNGHVRRSIPFPIGTPTQTISINPGCNPMCSDAPPTTAGCITWRGGFYASNASTSRITSDVYTSGADPFDGAPDAPLGGAPPAPNARDPTAVTWVRDAVQLDLNTSLAEYPLGVLHVDAGNQQSLLGLGYNSTFLSTLRSAGRIASRTWSMFYGRVGVTPSSHMDGTLVLGGYDQAKVLGQGAQAPLTQDGTCPTDMIVVVSGMYLNFPNGTDYNVFSRQKSTSFKACILPYYTSLISMPYDLFQDLNKGWGDPTWDNTRSTGLNFWNVVYNTNVAPYSGDLSIVVTVGGVDLSIRIPNNQLFMPDITFGNSGELTVNTSRQVALVYPLLPPNDKDLAVLGRNFLTAAYLMANQDTRTFTLWAANATTDSRLVGVDEKGSDITGNGCAQTNTTITSNTTNPLVPSSAPSDTIAAPVKNGLSSSSIIGIAVGAAGATALVALAAFLIYRYRKRRGGRNTRPQHSYADIKNRLDDAPLVPPELAANHEHGSQYTYGRHEVSGNYSRFEAPGNESRSEAPAHENRSPVEAPAWESRSPIELPGPPVLQIPMHKSSNEWR
ncbi:hypothetical protein K461DRAFT_268647 [Myriangium duriaei CBS 260.36]|uniref:Peptidase A1 domain-containing protein n=1 Tax=Myriangium duriaei CBS 260.36 TaxID=1168546 RepID=A0A9P4MMH7_9PEZI|nr:hypothetical protein K461DRAFT_268647 [Myriangium duriaei CBS 260.36]